MSQNAKPQAPRPRFGSTVDRETSRLTQLLVDSHTQIIRGLSLLAPKERRSRIRWILVAGFLVVAGVLAADRSTREFLTSKGRDFYRAHRSAEAAQAPVAPPAATASTTAAEAASAAAATSPGGAIQIPVAAVVASQVAEPVAPKEVAAPTVAPASAARPSRAPKPRGPSRPRTTSPQGGT
jgi:hypothetical protein